ncbi:uncharacterized protein LOC112576243 [Pomacea canaliculata]|uniref:uncharacterized protein LOC112576243 n=1 Tax=Pomacea canaliculata TaxID=400727 RepID=UPI000D73ADC1|nr:uncharacterized protein LOC112576243 [Pomacea canaliculata]
MAQLHAGKATTRYQVTGECANRFAPTSSATMRRGRRRRREEEAREGGERRRKREADDTRAGTSRRQLLSGCQAPHISSRQEGGATKDSCALEDGRGQQRSEFGFLHPAPPPSCVTTMTAEATMSRYNNWMARPRGYRYGSWLTFYGCGAHVVGFSTANWLTSSRSDCLGLWSYCNRSSCWQISTQDSPDWIESTRVLDCIGVGLTALWVLIGCPCDCLKSQQQRYRRLTRLEEIVAILSGCFGLLAAGMLTIWFQEGQALGRLQPQLVLLARAGRSMWMLAGRSRGGCHALVVQHRPQAGDEVQQTSGAVRSGWDHLPQ